MLFMCMFSALTAACYGAYEISVDSNAPVTVADRKPYDDYKFRASLSLKQLETIAQWERGMDYKLAYKLNIINSMKKSISPQDSHARKLLKNELSTLKKHAHHTAKNLHILLADKTKDSDPKKSDGFTIAAGRKAALNKVDQLIATGGTQRAMQLCFNAAAALRSNTLQKKGLSLLQQSAHRSAKTRNHRRHRSHHPYREG